LHYGGKGGSFPRQLYPPWQSPEQPELEKFFELANLLTDGRRRDVELLAGQPEAAVPGSGVEDTKKIERRKMLQSARGIGRPAVPFTDDFPFRGESAARPAYTFDLVFHGQANSL
jgi:hypothetical protein